MIVLQFKAGQRRPGNRQLNRMKLLVAQDLEQPFLLANLNIEGEVVDLVEDGGKRQPEPAGTVLGNIKSLSASGNNELSAIAFLG